jgi:acyl-CoA thioesterase I
VKYPRGSRLPLCLAAALSIGVLGCKGKAAPPPAPAAASPSAAAPKAEAETPDNRPVIVAFGDSLTAGYGTDAGNSYPDFLERDLEAKGFHYHVVNAGISGNTTKDGLDRLDEVLALKPAAVIVAFGGNDGLRGLPIDSTRSNLDQIVSALERTGTKVVLGGITLPPNYGADYIRQFNETYALLARKYHVPLLPFLLQDVYGTAGSMQADGIHATAQGNQQVARNLMPLLEPLLHRQ